MDFQTWIAASIGSWPDADVEGELTDPFLLGSLESVSGHLRFVDPMLLSKTDGVAVALPPGTYEVAVLGIDYNGHRRVAMLRILHPDADDFEIETAAIGYVGVDSGRISVLDTDDLAGRINDDQWPAAAHELNNAGLSTDADIVAIRVGDQSVQAVIATSGLGDGSYPVLALTLHGTTIGALIAVMDFDCDDADE